MCVILGNIAGGSYRTPVVGGVWVARQTHPLLREHVKSTYLFRETVLLAPGREACPLLSDSGSAGAAPAASPPRFDGFK